MLVVLMGALATSSCAQDHALVEAGAPTDAREDASRSDDAHVCTTSGSYSMVYELGTFFLELHAEGTWNLSSSNEGDLAVGSYVAHGSSVDFVCTGLPGRCDGCMGTYDLTVACEALSLVNTSISGCPGWPVPEGIYVRASP